ncbi:hypothetical protein CTEN210_12734 [Chaetoceros tenuissimus]|uniref:Protochlorophyllide reductase n=1 Tax=Chaetoceros tenuissimus TaxID=426638 RepID=A0AAD3D1W9_9STRA|nr:hypothetical protein CTEN210_12734 [Chaetoceros tenuissimus]
MPLLSTFATATGATLAASAFLLRRKISKNWVSLQKDTTLLEDQTIIITGGNVGLGYETAKDLSKRNAKSVIIACRNIEKGNEAVSSIQKATGMKNVKYMKLDLSSLDSVRAFLKKIEEEVPKVNVLICNAGVWIPEDANTEKTKDGYEMHFGVNHLAHYLLATSLKPKLEASGNGRIIFVSSSLMKSGQINFESKDFIYDGRKKDEESKSNFGPPPAYCDTKLMNAMTCRHLSKVLPSTVSTYSVCPGFCRSSLGRSVKTSFLQKALVAPIMLLIQRTALQGAQNILYATITPKEKLESGMLYKDGKLETDCNDYVDSIGEDMAKKLCELSDELLKPNE